MFGKLFGSRDKAEKREAKAAWRQPDLDIDVDIVSAYRNILTPIDMRHAEQSAKAIGVAAALAKGLQAKYYMLTVAYPFGEHLADMPDDLKPAFETFVSRHAAKAGIDITPVFRTHESATAVIHEVAGEFDIDLIVMASHDPRIADHVFNSNASEVALHNKCSVMVVR